MHMAPNDQKLFLPPEIVQEIASYCGYREQRDLAYTCKWFFESVAPIIWKEVHGVETLMKLMPGVKFTRGFTDSEGDYHICKILVVNEILLTEDWTRYWYYAPFVHHITPFSDPEGDMDATLHVCGWRFLLIMLKGSVLLPNLRSLNAKGLCLVSHFDRLAWFVILLSPSLQVLHLDDILSSDGIPPWPPTRSLSLLLGAISESPSTNLSLVSVTRDEWHPSEETLASLFPNEYLKGFFWFSDLSAPTGLRDLKITLLAPSALWDELCIIGSLPLLERLEMVFPTYPFSGKANHDLKKTPLPSSLFPSLCALSLKGASNIGLFRWVWGLKSMVSGLSSAHINMPNFGSSHQSLAVKFAQLVHDNSPNLVDLSISMSSAFDEMGALNIACGLLSVIPLQALTFDHFIGKVGYYPATHSESTFHHLRRLNISSVFQPPDWATLPKIAKAFPNLEYLSMSSSTQLESYKPLDVGCINHTAFQSIEIQILVHCSGRGPTRDKDQLDYIRNDIRTFLTAIWHNASITMDYSHSYTIEHYPDSAFYSSNPTVQDDVEYVPANANIRTSRDEGVDKYSGVFLFLACVLAWGFGVFRL